MYLKRALFVILTFLFSFDIGSVEGLKYRRTTKAPWIKSTTMRAEGIEKLGRSNNHPHDPPNYPPHYPSEEPPQNPPQIVPPSTIVDQYDNRCYDGSYEYRYELADETVRYERGYFISYQEKNILVVKGYYSHRLPDTRYLTVFYAADQFGNRQNSYFASHRPLLPRSLSTETDFADDANQSLEIENLTIINENKL